MNTLDENIIIPDSWIIQGGIWNVKSVEEQPSVTLESWVIIKVKKQPESIHFVGYAIENREGRVSSHIVTFDPETKRGQSASGRVYQLVGDSKWTGDSLYVWNNWMRIYGVSEDEYEILS